MEIKKGDTVELLKDTAFYKKGQRATVINLCRSNEIEIRYEGESYLGNDVDIMPKSLFRTCNCKE